MAERSGIHLTGEDSGWPVAAPAEPDPHKDGTGDDPHEDATAVAQGVVETGSEVLAAQTDAAPEPLEELKEEGEEHDAEQRAEREEAEADAEEERQDRIEAQAKKAKT